MLDITFYKKQNNDNFVPSTIELCDEDYEKLIVLNFAKSFHLEKECLIVEEEEYFIDAVHWLLFEELKEIKNYCRRIEGETIDKSKLNFIFVLEDVLSSLDECQYFSYVWNRGVLHKGTIRNCGGRQKNDGWFTVVHSSYNGWLVLCENDVWSWNDGI